MVSIIGYAMVRRNNHLPEEIYREIVSFLVPKYLLGTKEIQNYNQVITAIPRFEPVPAPQCIYSSYKNSFRTVRFIYRLKRKWRNITKAYGRNCIKVTLPMENTLQNSKQYHIYHLLQVGNGRHKKRMKRDLYKATYGINIKQISHYEPLLYLD